MLDFELSSIFTGNASVCNLRDSVSSSDCHIFSKLLGRSKAKIYSAKWWFTTYTLIDYLLYFEI